VEHSEGRFRGYKNLNLYYQSWLPPGDPQATLIVVHGLAEHSGRYINLAQYFASKGYAVYALDYRGHGKSEGLAGHVERFQDYVNDLRSFFSLVRGKQPDTKIFLFGHSVGGTIATAYTLNHQSELAGLILSGASLKIGSDRSPILIAVARTLSLLLPKMGITTIDASTISQDKAVVDAYVNDPLVYRGKIRARLGTELFKIAQELPRQIPNINLPLLIMHGTADRLSEPTGSQMLYERVSSKDKTLKLYEGFHHEILNEPEREQVLTDMEAWLASHV
jgi:alpha-beta hydrolase superfamily lysophospholipase